MPKRSIHMQTKFTLLFFFIALCFPGLSQNTNTVLRSTFDYPGQRLANIWGYVQDEKEYALVGARNGTSILDITDPDTPTEVAFIPGPSNNWKEIKTYGHYAYVVSEGGMGLQIIDLSPLPSSTLPYHSYYGDGAIQGQLNKGHALHVDTKKGFCYVYGSNINGGVPIVMDLNQDPYNPTYAGRFNLFGYVHDGYVDNDTMFACHIYGGLFSMVDMSSKLNPVVLATQTTPDEFPHNTWISDDRKTIFTTDEVSNSVLAAYDVSDPDDIKLLDVIQSNPGSNSIVHNTYVINDFAVTSWYRDGFTIVDASHPDNLVQVGNYDTYSGSGSGFNGCWGIYPYFPSGTIIASNISKAGANNDGELLILTPNYVRACRLEGLVKDGTTGFPIQGASVTIVAGTASPESTNNLGEFKMGQLENGYYDVTIEKAGFMPYSTQVYLQNGQVSYLDVSLFPAGSLTISGMVKRFNEPNPIPNAKVYLYGIELVYETTTDALGEFEFTDVAPGIYDITADALGYGMSAIHQQVLIDDTNGILIELVKGYRRGVKPRDLQSDLLPAQIELNPNPFQQSGLLCIASDIQDRALIMDLNGRLIQTIEVSPGMQSTPIGEQLPAGTYLIKMEKQSTHYRFVKTAN